MCTPTPEVKSGVPRLEEDHYPEYKGSGPWFTCQATGEMPPRMSKKGAAAVEPSTLPQLLAKGASVKGKRDAMLVERPCPPLENGRAPPALPREKWQTWTMESYHADVKTLAKAYIKLGFQQFDTANVWGFNSPEWFICAMAAMYAGGKSGGLYPTDTPATAGYKVAHSAGVICAVEKKDHIDKIVSSLAERGDCKRLKAFVSWSYEPQGGKEEVEIAGVGKVPVFGWKAFLEIGRAETDDELNKRIAATKPGHCCSLIYTSGTTGDPKAVMVSHDNLIYTSQTLFTTLGQSCGLGGTAEERILSYLPLSHVAGLALDLCSQIVMAARFPGWMAVFFARPYDLKVGTIKDRLLIARPTAFLGVPLVWEKMADRIKDIGAAATGLKKTMSTWAKGKALEHAKRLQIGGDGYVPNGLCLASRILKLVKSNVGLDQCKYACTGAAPIRVDTLEYYSSLGIYINELYGMSESSAASTVSTDQAHAWGACGWQINGTEIEAFKTNMDTNEKISKAPPAPGLDVTDEQYMGELCFRGRCIMMGYLACPDWGEDHLKKIEKKTADTIDSEGWLHSGDKGMKSKSGLLKITGRYKEIIIGEGGENIAPVPIEDSVKAFALEAGEVMMVGDKKKYNVALITLKAKGANGEVPGTDDLESAGLRLTGEKITKISQAMDDKTWIEHITKAISTTNANQKLVPNNAFKIQKFCILPSNFSEEGGELTPTKKLKRAVVEGKYAKLIDHMYATEGMYIRFKEL